MSAIITWSVDRMQCKPQEGDLTNVVCSVEWRCSGVDGDFFATVYGTCALGSPGSPFTPYEQLTESQVIEWCWAAGIDAASMEAAVTQKIQDQISPPVVQLPLPRAE